MRKKIYILLPVHNRREITQRFINCLRKQTYDNFHLILIDDGSNDGTDEMVRESISSLTVLKGTGDWWWAGALHQGYRLLNDIIKNQNDFVLLINDDTEFDDNFLLVGKDLLEKKQNSLILAVCYDKQSKKAIIAGVDINWEKFTFRECYINEKINCLSTRGLFLRFKDIQKIGGFHRFLLPHYFSDYEFTTRAYRKGFKLIADPQLKLWVDIQEDDNTDNISKKISFRGILKELFSKKNPTNPFYSIIFILLACPWKYKLTNILMICVKSLKRIFDQFIASQKFDV
jgi:GT2 family glycosyltransferase